MPGRYLVIAIALLALAAAGCVRTPGTGVTTIKATTPVDLQGHLLRNRPDVEQFRVRGPFEVITRENVELRLPGTQSIHADVYLAAPAARAPLVVLMHGYDNHKETHAYQAMHLASWGMHSVAVQLPNRGQWAANGKTLARLVSAIQGRPELVDARVDPSRIVLVGHSFGATSVAVALADGAPAAGAVMLDPAAIGRELPKLLQKVQAPVMVLGADEELAPSRNRSYFFRFIRSGIAELSIRDAVHEDAQYPLEQSLFAGDGATEVLQITFVSALTSAAFSLAATGKLDYAWSSFGPALEDGRFFNGRRK